VGLPRRAWRLKEYWLRVDEPRVHFHVLGDTLQIPSQFKQGNVLSRLEIKLSRLSTIEPIYRR
jgi:hypothetical protein